MKRILLAGICILAFNTNLLYGAEAKTAIQKQLASVAASELPAQAAQLVKDAAPAGREATTINVVKAAITARPAATTAVVGAIARAVPDVAGIAAGTATAQQPRQAITIARAAAAAAPSQAGTIVAAVCKAAPKEFRSVALVVAAAAPGSEKEVLRGLGTAFPNLGARIDQAINTYTANPSLFNAVLNSLNATPAASTGTSLAALPSANPAGPALRGPVMAPPYVTPSDSPTTLTPGTSGQVPAGGRDYAKP